MTRPTLPLAWNPDVPELTPDQVAEVLRIMSTSENTQLRALREDIETALARERARKDARATRALERVLDRVTQLGAERDLAEAVTP